VLSDDTATKAGANLTASCIDSKAGLVVLSNRTSFDVCSTVVPHGFSSEATRSIVAAVGGGPHSLLAATLADWLSQMLGVPACAVYGHSDPSDLSHGEDVLSRTVARLPRMDVRTVEASGPAAMVGALRAGTLLIVGAPGGSWFQRRFFGPGARIVAKAPSGTIVVNHSPARIYRVMQPPLAYGPNMRVSDALQLSEGSDVVVAENGKLLGTVKAETLRGARRDLELHQFVDGGLFLSQDDEISEAIDLIATYGGGLVPVVDDQERLVGCVSGADLSIRPLG
jgi:CBS domain-containing protein